MKFYRYCSLFNKWDSNEQQKWQELSAGGKWRFILIRGVLVFGTCCFVLMTGFMLMEQETFTAGVRQIVVSNLAIWACAGAIWGHLSWWGTNKSYAEKFGSGGAGS